MPPTTPRTTANDSAPGGLSSANFKAICAEAGQWLWGTVRGAFNEKASLSQIIVDAVIGMIPLVGDATAVRDLIAVVVGLIDDPEKRKKVWEWVLVIVLVFALIPVLGGVIKGVGRIMVKLTEDAAALTIVARSAHLAQGAKDIVAFLNRIGYRNAEAWFKELRISAYQTQLVDRFKQMLETISGALVQIRRKLGDALPASLANRIDGLRNGLATLKELAGEMIPKAVKELDQMLREVQAFVHSGGETTSRTVAHEIAIGKRAVTRADEARLIETGPLPARSVRGWKQNEALAGRPDTYEHLYKYEQGYPDLQKTTTEHCAQIEAFSGKIVNRPLKPGERIYRLFGPEGTTHQFEVGESFVNGGWWGLGAPPKSAKEWREKSAVLDEWNRDGFMIVGTVVSGHELRAAVGTISEQAGKNIPGQFLPGGAMQAVLGVDSVTKAGLTQAAKEVISLGKPVIWLHPISGMRFDISATGWKDANGIWGYIRIPGKSFWVQTSRLTSRERATKDTREVLQ